MQWLLLPPCRDQAQPGPVSPLSSLLSMVLTGLVILATCRRWSAISWRLPSSGM